MKVKKGKVALGLSGGVDSAVAAARLLKQGHEVTGVFMECYREEGCRSDQDRKDALAVALELGIPLVSLDFREAYREKVLAYFYDEYQAGRTPNPDVLCNREIKFGLFADWAWEQGYEWLATGHYAEVANKNELNERGEFDNFEQEKFLVMARDEWKDQTYFLNQISGEILPKIIFPLGRSLKSEVRDEARELGLVVSEKKDSTGVCFVGEINVREFLKKKLGEQKGKIVDLEGKVVGEHEGTWFYTLGQRQGLRVEVKSPDSAPLFVVGKDVEKNELVVGGEESTRTRKIKVQEMNWLISWAKWGAEVRREWWLKQIAAGRVTVRIRHTGELVQVKKGEWDEQVKNGKFTLEKEVKGVSEGQFGVFYLGHQVCLGGGILI